MNSALTNLLKKTSDNSLYPKNKPVFFKLGNLEQEKELEKLLSSGEIRKIIDNYGEQDGELALVKDPTLILNKKENASVSSGIDDSTLGNWIYLPWSQTLIHALEAEDYELMRLSRNKKLISDESQEKMRQLTIGVAGLNVGNSGAICLAQEGVNKFKLADLDILSVSNLNRFRAGLSEVEMDKTLITAKQIYEINPYVDITFFDKGIQPDNIDKFLNEPKIDLLIEEMDNLKLKIAIRQKARDLGIPVLMVTGNGSNIIIDVERYDLDNTTEILNGFLKKEIIEQVDQVGPNTSLRDKLALARDFMGKEVLVKNLYDSFDQVGVTLAGIPQVAEATFLRGAALAFFTRKIFEDKIPSGRYFFGLDGLVK